MFRRYKKGKVKESSESFRKWKTVKFIFSSKTWLMLVDDTIISMYMKHSLLTTFDEAYLKICKNMTGEWVDVTFVGKALGWQ